MAQTKCIMREKRYIFCLFCLALYWVYLKGLLIWINGVDMKLKSKAGCPALRVLLDFSVDYVVVFFVISAVCASVFIFFIHSFC